MAAPAETKSLPVPWPEDAEIKVHSGGCHCKKIRYEFEHPDVYGLPVMNCNCSICEDRGYLNVFTPENKFRFTNGSADDLTTYEFGKGNLSHKFCSTCGTSIGPAASKQGCVVVNARTIDGIDLDRLKLFKFDGRST
ncbi:glutathione-dependent formaldehyde-activating GFA [Mycena sanguinolenta]|nr:glutathione-dependent formaldehyde-activating GFA [Mycena sanguinolenta]